MKKLFMICLALVVSAGAIAQMGTVVYDETIKLEIHLEGAAVDFQDLIPKEQKTSHLLHFTPEASLFTNQKQEKDAATSDQMSGGGSVVVEMERPDEKVYFDIRNQKVIEQREFMSRTFLINSPVDSLAWKLTGNRREILGNTCLEAFYVKDTSKTFAWFAPSIPVSTGPGKYRGLPGLILEVNVNNGERIITATSYKQSDVSALLIKPKQGKKVTRDEFNAIVEEKTGQMKTGEGGFYMIKITK